MNYWNIKGILIKLKKNMGKKRNKSFIMYIILEKTSWVGGNFLTTTINSSYGADERNLFLKRSGQALPQLWKEFSKKLSLPLQVTTLNIVLRNLTNYESYMTKNRFHKSLFIEQNPKVVPTHCWENPTSKIIWLPATSMNTSFKKQFQLQLINLFNVLLL